MNKLSDAERILVLEAAAHLGTITPGVIEKDIHVTRAIHAISEIKHPEINIIFCGGTCLAKAYHVIYRMSEDIDFKIYSKIPFSSFSEQRRKLRAFRDEVSEFLKKSGFEINENTVRSRDNNSYTVYHLDYQSHFEQHKILRPHIQIEFTLASPRLPTVAMPIATMVADIFPDEVNLERNIDCISILETAAEKWVGLTRRTAAIARGYDPDDMSLVRHIYDLYAISKQIILDDSFLILVSETIERDQTKFKKHLEYKIDFASEIRHSINLLRQDLEWARRYNIFVESMVYEAEKIKFDVCYEKLQEMTEEILKNLSISPD